MANHNMRVNFFSERPSNHRQRIEVTSKKAPRRGQYLIKV